MMKQVELLPLRRCRKQLRSRKPLPTAPTAWEKNAAAWQRRLRDWLDEGHDIAELGPWLLDNLPDLATDLGEFRKILESHEVPAPELAAQHAELLPVSLKGIEDMFQERRHSDLVGWVVLIFLVLNFYFCSSPTGYRDNLKHKRDLTCVQKKAVTHVTAAVSRFLRSKSPSPPAAEGLRSLLPNRLTISALQSR